MATISHKIRVRPRPEREPDPWDRRLWTPSDINLGLRMCDMLDPPDHPYMLDPVGWIHHIGEETWSGQETILESLVENPKTGVWSAHATGKSHIASRAIAWWVDTHPVDDVFVVTSAPSAPQVRGILWRYAKDIHRKAHLPGNITDAEIPEWKVDGRLVGWGRKPQNLTSEEQAKAVFQGIHAKYVLVVFDEADGIPKWLWDAAATLLTSMTNRMLAIGNPDNPASHFATIRNDKMNDIPDEDGDWWNKITISAYDTPAYTGEPVSQNLKDHLVTRAWVRGRIKEWGKDNALVRSKVDAQYPEIGDDILITPGMIQKCIAAFSDLPGDSQGRYSADIARMGADKCVVYRNRGGVMSFVAEWGKTDTAETTRNLIDILAPHQGGVSMIIDIGGGLGAAPFDAMRMEGHPVQQFDGSAKPLSDTSPREDGLRFQNRRAEQYWALREECDRSAVGIEPTNLRLQAQLLNIKYDTTATGRIKIEAKQDIKKRAGDGASPDHADTVMMATVPADEWGLYEMQKVANSGHPDRNKAPGSICGDLLNMKT